MTGANEGVCSKHPCAPHGFSRNASHSEHRYVCDCEGWRPEPGCDGLALLARAEAAEAALAAMNAGVDCEALRVLLAKATPGEWTIHPRAETTVLAGDGYSVTSCDSNMFDSHKRNVVNAQLTVAAVNALPFLIARIRELERIEAAVMEARPRCVIPNQWDDVFAKEGHVIWCSDLPAGERFRLVPESLLPVRTPDTGASHE